MNTDALGELLLSLVGTPLLFWVMWRFAGWINDRRASGAKQRALAVGRGDEVRFPVWVRGKPPAYPGYWRRGSLSSADAGYRPRGRWGEPLDLSGLTIVDVRDPTKTDAVYASAELRFSYKVLECVDRGGSTVLLATPPGDAKLLAEALKWATRGGAVARRMRLLRGVRNRLPMVLASLIAVGVVAAAPLALAVGAVVPLRLLGWPRTGTLITMDAAEGEIVAVLLPTALGLFMGGVFLYSGRLPRPRPGVHTDSAD